MMKYKNNVNYNDIKIEDILSPEEKKMYANLLKEIEENQSFFTSASTEEIVTYLMDHCGLTKEEIYKLFKKIVNFDNKKR